jgi:hypothetical protein
MVDDKEVKKPGDGISKEPNKPSEISDEDLEKVAGGSCGIGTLGSGTKMGGPRG